MGAGVDQVGAQTDHDKDQERDASDGEADSDGAFRGRALHRSIVRCGRGRRYLAAGSGDATLSRRYHLRMPNDFAVEALGRCALFSGLGAEPLAALAATLRTRRFRRGEVLFHEGDPGDALFIVASGAVKVVVPSEDGDEAILATLRRGDFLGELALLDGAPRSASAIALEATETLALPRDRFHALVDSEPAIRDALFGSLAAELRRLTAHVAELHFLDLTGRLAARLVRLADEHGTLGPDGSIRLDAPLTQSDVAAMIGATRQSVNKLLGEFVDKGLIRLDRETIVIPDREALIRASRR
jgi:CRP/FNR family transcriptional regulator, cyclic AMP receptor protein